MSPLPTPCFNAQIFPRSHKIGRGRLHSLQSGSPLAKGVGGSEAGSEGEAMDKSLAMLLSRTMTQGGAKTGQHLEDQPPLDDCLC